MGIIVVGVIILILIGMNEAYKTRNPLHILVVVFMIISFMFFIYASMIFGG